MSSFDLALVATSEIVQRLARQVRNGISRSAGVITSTGRWYRCHEPQRMSYPYDPRRNLPFWRTRSRTARASGRRFPFTTPTGILMKIPGVPLVVGHLCDLAMTSHGGVPAAAAETTAAAASVPTINEMKRNGVMADNVRRSRGLA